MAVTECSAVVRQLWPLLLVKDIERSLRFYHGQLGFALVAQAQLQGKMFWCRLERGGASLMLQQAEEEDGTAEGRGLGVAFYFHCNDADAMHAELTSHGLQLDPPAMTDYGMKQLFVPEPDGYSICFESDSPPAAP
jgi:catechol 2,3-dioxygenase-like lactoylglutathione lyase family enzyme